MFSCKHKLTVNWVLLVSCFIATPVYLSFTLLSCSAACFVCLSFPHQCHVSPLFLPCALLPPSSHIDFALSPFFSRPPVFSLLTLLHASISFFHSACPSILLLAFFLSSRLKPFILLAPVLHSSASFSQHWLCPHPWSLSHFLFSSLSFSPPGLIRVWQATSLLALLLSFLSLVPPPPPPPPPIHISLPLLLSFFNSTPSSGYSSQFCCRKKQYCGRINLFCRYAHVRYKFTCLINTLNRNT